MLLRTIHINILIMCMHHPSDRRLLNLLRLELAYIWTCCKKQLKSLTLTVRKQWKHTAPSAIAGEEKLEDIAEDKLVSFCGQILKEA